MVTNRDKGRLAEIFAVARIGDWDSLAAHIERGGEITPEMREFLAGVLRKKVKRAANRPPKEDTRLFHKAIAMFRIFLQEQRGLSATAAEARVAEDFGVDRSTVQRAMRRLKAEADKSPTYRLLARRYHTNPMEVAIIDIRENFPWGSPLLGGSGTNGPLRGQKIIEALTKKYGHHEIVTK
jgi:hypothetical protein